MGELSKTKAKREELAYAAGNTVKPQVEPPPAKERKSTTTPGRIGKKAVVGHFSEAMSHALMVQAVDERTSIQALIGEALDDLRKKRGLPPFGER